MIEALLSLIFLRATRLRALYHPQNLLLQVWTLWIWAKRTPHAFGEMRLEDPVEKHSWATTTRVFYRVEVSSRSIQLDCWFQRFCGLPSPGFDDEVQLRSVVSGPTATSRKAHVFGWYKLSIPCPLSLLLLGAFWIIGHSQNQYPLFEHARTISSTWIESTDSWQLPSAPF